MGGLWGDGADPSRSLPNTEPTAIPGRGRGALAGSPSPTPPSNRVARACRIGSVIQRPRPRPDRPHPRRRQRGGVAVGATAGTARERPAGVGRVALDAPVVVRRRRLLRRLLDRPPHDVDQGGDRELQRQHQPQKSPRHSGNDPTLIGPLCHARGGRAVFLRTRPGPVAAPARLVPQRDPLLDEARDPLEL